MENLAKQARSRKRIEKIFETAENLFNKEGKDYYWQLRNLGV